MLVYVRRYQHRAEADVDWKMVEVRVGREEHFPRAFGRLAVRTEYVQLFGIVILEGLPVVALWSQSGLLRRIHNPLKSYTVQTVPWAKEDRTFYHNRAHLEVHHVLHLVGHFAQQY